MNLEELQDAANAARDKYIAADTKRDTFVSERRSHYEQIIQQEAADYSVERNLALAALHLANTAAADEKDRIARTGANAPLPVGTVMIEWKPPLGFAGRTWSKTGRRGLIEMVTKDSKHAENLSRYSRAGLGTCVIRILKKDGTPSIQYTEYLHGHRWTQEHEDKNASE